MKPDAALLSPRVDAVLGADLQKSSNLTSQPSKLLLDRDVPYAELARAGELPLGEKRDQERAEAELNAKAQTAAERLENEKAENAELKQEHALRTRAQEAVWEKIAEMRKTEAEELKEQLAGDLCTVEAREAEAKRLAAKASQGA